MNAKRKNIEGRIKVSGQNLKLIKASCCAIKNASRSVKGHLLPLCLVCEKPPFFPDQCCLQQTSNGTALPALPSCVDTRKAAGLDIGDAVWLGPSVMACDQEAIVRVTDMWCASTEGMNKTPAKLDVNRN